MSLVHYLTIGFFDLGPGKLSPGFEPAPLRPLDREWVEQTIAATDSGCLWAIFPSDDIVRTIVDHHGPGCVAVHQNQGIVFYPPAGVAEQYRVNGWPPPAG